MFQQYSDLFYYHCTHGTSIGESLMGLSIRRDLGPNFRSISRNERGSTILGALIAAGLALSAITISTGQISNLFSQFSTVKEKYDVSLIRHNILMVLNNSEAWQNTLLDGENKFAYCRENVRACYTSEQKLFPLSIRSSNNSVLVYGAGGTGFYGSGLICQDGNCPVMV
jgi:hypothetical protein